MSTDSVRERGCNTLRNTAVQVFGFSMRSGYPFDGYLHVMREVVMHLSGRATKGRSALRDGKRCADAWAQRSRLSKCPLVSQHQIAALVGWMDPLSFSECNVSRNRHQTLTGAVASSAREDLIYTSGCKGMLHPLKVKRSSLFRVTQGTAAAHHDTLSRA